MKTTKTLLLACTTFLTTVAFAQTPARNASGSAVPMKSYGEKIVPDGAVSVVQFTKMMDGRDSLRTKLACEVITSCTKKGCWMDVQLPEGKVMKVRFKDYGFFVPTHGLEGKTAVLEGTAYRETIDVATLQHYAHDAGKSEVEIAQITEPQQSITFTADGVLIGD
ncbi:MAG: DUF4920 domain-containing protein [Flavobacteriales bacterium]|nr:DUF4920 domain-containing protein [Flavobacteriales bacterium]MCB9168081.1 DUF4920 domain-containing protein [Flavobacteriales bacterium]